MFGSTSKEEIVGKTSHGFNTIFGEKDMTAVVQVDFMQSFMPEKRRDDVEDELHAVEIEEE